MTTKYRYFIYLLCLHLLIGWLAYLLLREQLYWLLAVEVAIFMSLAVSFSFYKVFMTPTEVIDHGEAALSDGDFTAKFTSSDSPEVERLIRLYNSMIDNLRQERTGKEEQHYFLQKLMAAAEIGIVILDYDGRIASVNPWAIEKLGLDQETVTGIPIADLENPFIRQLAALDNDRPTLLQRGGGQRFRVEKGRFVDRGFDRTFLLIQDITSDLQIAEKEAYGKVIRMMAHEVNNSIGATQSMLSSLLDEEDLQPLEYAALIREYLPLIIERGRNMNRFMQQFASVIRLPEPNLEPTDLVAMLYRVGQLFTGSLAEGKIKLALPDTREAVMVRADPAQLELVIINALTNARESLGDQPGSVRMTVQRSPAGFTVADNGPGIPPEEAAKVFTPFYSSKPTGQGIGLTLSRDILRGHGAGYDLSTSADGWTRFTVTFQ